MAALEVAPRRQGMGVCHRSGPVSGREEGGKYRYVPARAHLQRVGGGTGIDGRVAYEEWCWACLVLSGLVWPCLGVSDS